MKQRVYLILFIIVALGLTSFYFPNHLKAESELDKINQKLKELDKAYKETLSTANKLQEDIKQIEKDRKLLMSEITYYESKLNELAEAIDKKEEEIESTKKRLLEIGTLLDEAIQRVEERDKLLKTRVRAMYETGDISYLEVLLDSSSIGDFLTRLDMVQKIVESDKSILEENIRDKEEIEANKREVEALEAQLLAQLDELTNRRLEYQKMMKERSIRVAALNQQEDEKQRLIEEANEGLAQIAKQKAKLLETKNRLSGGRLLWPLPDSTRITDTFGPRIHPVTGKKSTHTGIDIGAPTGTDIVAAESGVVILAAYYGAYGNTVMIDHGGGIVTMYGHIRNGGIKVKEGQEVKRGQKIAEVGSTGLSTGPHLHFSVINDGEYKDPMKYLKSK